MHNRPPHAVVIALNATEGSVRRTEGLTKNIEGKKADTHYKHKSQKQWLVLEKSPHKPKPQDKGRQRQKYHTVDCGICTWL